MIRKTYDYHNVFLIPRLSNVNSRDYVDLSVELPFRTKLDFPIVASPMKGITSFEIVKKISELGGIGIFHRFQPIGDVLEFIKTNPDLKLYGIAIGLDGDYKTALDCGAKIICVDVANGYLKSVRDFCFEISSYIVNNGFHSLLMAGNVVTSEGMRELQYCGVNLIRVGIGTGNLCTTRTVTGIGYGQISALMECSKGKNSNTLIVADGGIKSSGDAVKALAAGADLILIGSLLGKTYESSHNGIIYGMASRKLQEEYYHSVKSVEGIEREMEKTMSLEDFISEFTYGMRSAFTYLGARNILELRENSEFVEII